jgi:hypothetical protein
LRGGGSVSKVTMRGVQRKKIRLNTNELPAFLDANQLHSQHRAFSRPMEFPFLGIWTSPDLVRYRHPKWPLTNPRRKSTCIGPASLWAASAPISVVRIANGAQSNSMTRADF